MYYVRNTELYHYGIQGQKWGIRRYQNEDGSLTEEGKKRYRYGSVSVRHKNGYAIVSKQGYNKNVNIDDNTFRWLETNSEDEIVRQLSKQWAVSTKTMHKWLSTNQDTINYANKLIDEAMDLQLSEIISMANEYAGGENNKKTTNTNKEKPKYTQEEAIEKAYSDLEKKYPKFNSYSQDKQDKLFFNYLNSSGLYQYV